ncbi:MAG: hypothetical protein ACYCT2_05885 [Thermoplasmataceae archaeon]
MNAKAIALMIVGIVLVSFVFSYFHVGYPTGIPDIKQNVQVFQIQGYNGIGLGNGKTTISPQGKADVVIQGYIKNASSNSPLENSQLYAFLSLADTSTLTSSSGFYKITVLYSGTYTLAFKVYSYKTQYVSLSVFGNSVWNNMSFTPAHRFTIEGKTVGFKSPSTVEPHISMNLQGFFGQPDFLTTKSNANGYFNVSAYNDSYDISVTTPQYGRTTVPTHLNVSGPQKSLDLIQVLPLKYYSVSGYILNNLTKPVSGATVQSSGSNGSTTSNGTGYYNLTVQNGHNNVGAYKLGFGEGFKSTIISKNTTDFNITLININPFSVQGSNGSGTGVSGIPPSAGGNISKALQGNTSSVNYAKGPSTSLYSLSGNITDSTTGQKVVFTYLKFYLNVNGTIFYENVTTNGTGYYHLVLQYPGNYTFVVYSPFYDDYQFSYKVTGNQYWNFNLKPYANHVYTVTGYVKNKLGSLLKGITVSANYVYAPKSSNVSTEYNLTDASGRYSLSVFEANYTFSASGLGYATNYTAEKNVDGNLGDVNITLPYINPFSSASGSGTSGVSQPQLSNLTSFLNGQGNGSTVFYNETGGPGKYNITGVVTNSNNSLPVFKTSLEFFANVSGTTYYATVVTGPGGQYVLNLSYKGNYTLAVYSPDYYLFIHNFTIRGNLTASFEMTPMPNYVFSVSGAVLNAESPVNTSKISVGIDGTYYTARQNTTNSTGNYSIYLIKDSNPDYSLHFSAPGYYNSTVNDFPVTKNSSVRDHSMTPLASIGKGVSILNPSSLSGTGSPSLSPSALQNDLGSKNDNGSFAIANNTTDPVTLKISLLNVTSSKQINDAQFIGYIKIDGAIYRFVNHTNSTGYYDLRLNLTGTMAVLVSTLSYKNSSEQFLLSSTANHTSFNLSTAARYQEVIHLNSTYNSAWQIPNDLSVVDSLLTISNTSSSALANGTSYTYYLQNGTYNFTFNNVSYVPASFYGNISGSNTVKYYTLTNYLLEINNNSALSWNYSVSNTVTSFHENHKVVRLVTYINLTQGEFHFEPLLNGSVYASTTFSLSATSPSENITFSVTLGNQTFKAQDSGKEVYTNVSITNVNSGNVSIYEIGVNATWSTSANLSLNGKYTNATNTPNPASHNTNFSLTNYYKYSFGSYLNITISGSGVFTLDTSHIEVLYYITSLNQGGTIKLGK